MAVLAAVVSLSCATKPVDKKVRSPVSGSTSEPKSKTFVGLFFLFYNTLSMSSFADAAEYSHSQSTQNYYAQTRSSCCCTSQGGPWYNYLRMK